MVEAFFIVMFTLIMVAYLVSSTALAIAAGQSLVSIATFLMNVSFVFVIFLGLFNFRTIVPWLSCLQYLRISQYGCVALQHNKFWGQNFCPGTIKIANNTCSLQYVLVKNS